MESIHELTAGYALDALDGEERAAYESHLETCESCQADLAALWETTAALAVAASGPAPGVGLRDRVVAQAREEKDVVVPLESRRRRTLAPALAAVAAIAAVVAVGVGIWASSLSSDLDSTRAALARERAAAAVLASPDSRSVALQPGRAEGRLVVGEDGRAVLVLDGLGPAPAGKTYQVWIVPHGGAPVSGGVFEGSDGRDVLPVEGSVENGEVVAVTIEKSGGARAPTTKPIVGTMPV